MTLPVTDIFEETIRSYIMDNLLRYASGEQKLQMEQENIKELVLSYMNWTDRLIAPQARTVLFSDEIMKNAQFAKFSDAIWSIHTAFSTGGDLRPYLSKGVFKNAVSGKDGMLNEWGFHHLHLGKIVENKGEKIVNRTRELLFVSIFERYVCFIDIFTHDDFSNTTAVETLYKNWPEILEPMKLKGVLASENDCSSVERRKLRDAGMTTHVTIGNNVFMPPRCIVSSGHSLSTVDSVSMFFERLENVRINCKNNAMELAKKIDETSKNPLDNFRLDIKFSSPPYLTPFSIVESNSNVGITGCGEDSG